MSDYYAAYQKACDDSAGAAFRPYCSVDVPCGRGYVRIGSDGSAVFWAREGGAYTKEERNAALAATALIAMRRMAR